MIKCGRCASGQFASGIRQNKASIPARLRSDQGVGGYEICAAPVAIYGRPRGACCSSWGRQGERLCKSQTMQMSSRGVGREPDPGASDIQSIVYDYRFQVLMRYSSGPCFRVMVRVLKCRNSVDLCRPFVCRGPQATQAEAKRGQRTQDMRA